MSTIRFWAVAMAMAAISSCALAIGFDQRGAQEANGLSREFDDATRLRQLQDAPPPLVEVSQPMPAERPAPVPRTSQQDANPAPLLQATKLSSDALATRSLQEAERQQQRDQRGGFWQSALRFALWMAVGAAMTWGVWSWVVRRASNGLSPQ